MAKPKTESKLTYKFISELKNLLEGGNWRQHHQARIDELSKSLEQSPEEIANAKVASIRERGGKFDDKNYPKMIESFTRAQEATKAEIAQLQANMEQGVYTIGIAPFYTAEDAQQMLAAAHILEVGAGSYDQGAVSAIRNMLEANFAELCTPEVVGKMFVGFWGRRTPKEDDVILDKVVKGETLAISDLLFHPDNEDGETIKNIQTIIENNAFIDKEVLGEIAKEMTFIEKFYLEGKFSIALFSMVCAQYFNSIQSVKSFFERFVDCSTIQAVEKAIPIEVSVAKLSSFDPEELKIWREVIELNGPKALKVFIKISNLDDTGINILAIVQEHGVENAFSVINDRLQEVSKFVREEEHPEFAGLCYKYDVPEEKFNQVLDEAIPHQKTSDTLPDISFQFKLGKHTYSFEKLKPGSLEGLFLGKMTDCCQFIGGEGEKYAVRGFVKPDTGFYVIRDEEGKIKAQSYAWRSNFKDKDAPVMVFDSFEFMPELQESFLPVIKKYQSILTEQTDLSLVIGTGGKTPRIDTTVFGGVEKEAKNTICPEFDGSENFMGEDSSSVYVINQDTKAIAEASFPVFTSYDELMHVNSRFTLARLVEKYQEQYTALSDQEKFNFITTSNVIYLLLEAQIVDIDGVINLITYHEGRNTYSCQNHNFSAYENCKQKIAECKKQGITDPKEVIDYVFPIVQYAPSVVPESPEEIALREARAKLTEECGDILSKITTLQDEQKSIDNIIANLERYKQISDEVAELFKLFDAIWLRRSELDRQNPNADCAEDHSTKEPATTTASDHDLSKGCSHHEFVPDHASVELAGDGAIEQTEALT
jgi:hypothetical protein